MLNAEKIENQDYCTNDIADLMMRFQKAYKTIEFMTTELMKIDNPDCFVKEAYAAGLNGLAGMEFEHTCDIQPDSNGIYRCECDLIANGELNIASDRMKVGDYIEFLSDRQTEKGPSIGFVKTIVGTRVLIQHSDCSEEFNYNQLIVKKKTTHHDGGTLWILR